MFNYKWLMNLLLLAVKDIMIWKFLYTTKYVDDKWPCICIWFVIWNWKGTNTIEVIIANLNKDRKVKWCGKAFGQMKSLRILIIRNGWFSRGPQILPNSLKVLDWSGYQSSSLPSDFNPKNLAILNLPESCLKRFESFKACNLFKISLCWTCSGSLKIMFIFSWKRNNLRLRFFCRCFRCWIF